MNSSVDGELTGVSLASLLQMIEIEKHSCVLKIISDQQTGYLCIQTGLLIAASTDNLAKEKAAFEIISWEPVRIIFDKSGKRIEKEMSVSLMALLMESARLKDEMSSKSRSGAVEPDPITKESAFEQLKGLDNKTVRQELDALNLPRSSKLRIALTRIVRDAFDADALAAGIIKEAAIIGEQEDKTLLLNLKEDNGLPSMNQTIALLCDQVNGKGK